MAAAILVMAGTSDVWPTIKMRIAIRARNLRPSEIARLKSDPGTTPTA